MAEACAFPSDTLAPWAQIVPNTGPTTVADLLNVPDDGWRYEVVEGVLVRVAGSGAWATTIGRRLGARMGDYVDEHDLGLVTGADGVFKFPGAETGLLPDVGYLAAERADLLADLSKPIPFPPDLAAEVTSPSQDADAMAAKVRQYLQGGTALVWVFWPERGEVDVWRLGDLRPRHQDMRPSTTLHVDTGDVLDGEDVVPGFSCPLAPLFVMRRGRSAR
ncbi:MAG TPA: Uma2 family endonuclease [Chloroflexota bacterium]|nr:Uma2 family endonuclease [Chloroflexota bacterium]